MGVLVCECVGEYNDVISNLLSWSNTSSSAYLLKNLVSKSPLSNAGSPAIVPPAVPKVPKPGNDL